MKGMQSIALLLSLAFLPQTLTFIIPGRTSPPISTPNNVSTASNADPICFSVHNPPHTPPFYSPSAQDCLSVLRGVNDEDTRRPPRLSTFAQAGTLSPHRVDFVLPIVITKGTCRAVLAMRSGLRIGHGFIYEFAEAVAHVRDWCAEDGRPGLGGGIFVGDAMKLVVYGLRGQGIEEGEVIMENGTSPKFQGAFRSSYNESNLWITS